MACAEIVRNIRSSVQEIIQLLHWLVCKLYSGFSNHNQLHSDNAHTQTLNARQIMTSCVHTIRIPKTNSPHPAGFDGTPSTSSTNNTRRMASDPVAAVQPFAFRIARELGQSAQRFTIVRCHCSMWCVRICDACRRCHR